jgi:glycosidase
VIGRSTAHFVRLGATLAFALTAQDLVSQTASAATQPRRAEIPWYVKSAAMHRVTLKPSTRFWRFEHLSVHERDASSQLRAWKDEGIDAIEIFAPEEGGNSYDGLDAKNRYALDPGLGTMDEFQRLIKTAHAIGIAVVTFQNFGYAAIDAPQFMKAEDDVQSGRTTRESQFFYWSNQKDALPPAKGDSYFLIQPAIPGYDPSKTEFWQWSDRAQHFYWTRWPGKDASGEGTHLPQYNWSSAAWPTEASNVVDFWMKTDIDGVVVDAVNWYVGYDWQKNADFLKIIRKYSGARLTIPEGGGAFHTDDPVGEDVPAVVEG